MGAQLKVSGRAGECQDSFWRALGWDVKGRHEYAGLKHSSRLLFVVSGFIHNGRSALKTFVQTQVIRIKVQESKKIKGKEKR